MKRWHDDVEEMHEKFGVGKRVSELNKEELKEFLEFRYRFLEEELKEMREAIDTEDAEEIVDSLIDLCVVAIGTLDLFEINKQRAWQQVHNANMRKEPGIKLNRPNPLKLPDLCKPKGWYGPSHLGNHGKFGELFNE